MKNKVFVMPAVHLFDHKAVIRLAVNICDYLFMKKRRDAEPALHPTFHHGSLHGVGVEKPSFQKPGVTAHFLSVMFFVQGEEGVHGVGKGDGSVLNGARLLDSIKNIRVILPDTADGYRKHVQVIFRAYKHICGNIDKIRIMVEPFNILQRGDAGFVSFYAHE